MSAFASATVIAVLVISAVTGGIVQSVRRAWGEAKREGVIR